MSIGRIASHTVVTGAPGESILEITHRMGDYNVGTVVIVSDRGCPLGIVTDRDVAIRAAHRAGRRIDICGQTPSDYPEFARALLREEIDSISLTPDALLATLSAVAEAEEEAKAE